MSPLQEQILDELYRRRLFPLAQKISKLWSSQEPIYRLPVDGDELGLVPRSEIISLLVCLDTNLLRSIEAADFAISVGPNVMAEAPISAVLQ